MFTCFKKLLVSLAILFSVTSIPFFVASTPTFAAGPSNVSTPTNCVPFLGMTPWYCGIDENVDSQDKLTSNAIIIASNVLTDLGVIATYLVIGYVIYGGYLYIFSNGDASKVMSAKRTLSHAFIGLAIVMLATVILNTIRIAFMGSAGSFAENCATSSGGCVDPTDFVSNIITWFIGSAGAVALLFVFIGGIGYLTSAGDASKLQKAKNTITYALIGLAIVALSLTITAFVTNLIKNANSETAYNHQITIAKEYHHEN